MAQSADGRRGDLEYGTIANLVAAAGDRYGAAVAIEDGPRTLTFAELAAAARSGARGFLAAGVCRGDRVAIWAPNVWEWVVAALSAMRVGAILVPINTRYRGQEAAYVLQRSGAKILLTVNGFLDTDYVAMLEGDDTPLPALEATVVLRGEVPATAVAWQAFVDAGSAISAEAEAAAAAAVRPDDLSDVMFTSGTTGHPKGVMCTNAQSLRAYRDWSDVVGLQAGDRYLVVAPFFHTFGYKAGWLSALMMGATVLPQAVFDPAAVLARIAPDRVTVVPGPPALYQTFLGRGDLADYDLSSLRLAVTGAAVIPVEMIEKMKTVLGFDTIITGYGLTECTGIVTMCRHEDDPKTIAQTSGRAIPGVEVKIVGDGGEDLPANEAGEVLVRGYNVTQGYLDDAEATAATIDADGWLATGDIGMLDERGYIRITDRKKDMFIVGGFNTYPAEIENTLQTHEGVQQAAVVGMKDERLGEVGCAFIVPKQGSRLGAAELTAWCRARMANFKVPRMIVFVPALPLNATGKVKKFELRERLAKAAQSGLRN